MSLLYQSAFVPRKLNSPIARRATFNSPKNRRSAIRRLSRDAMLATESSPPDKQPAFSCLGNSAKIVDPVTRDLSLSRMASDARQTEIYSLAPKSHSHPGSFRNAPRPASALPTLPGRAATRPPSPRRLRGANVTGTPVKAKPEEAPPLFTSPAKPLFASPTPPTTLPPTTVMHTPQTASSLARSARIRARTAGAERKAPERKTPALRKPALAALGVLRLEGSLRRLAFVDRSLLASFSQCTSYFKEHWSTRALPGGAFRSDHASIFGAVPCLAELLADAGRKQGAVGMPCGVTLVPYASHPPTPSVQLPAGAGALDDALVIHCDGDFARVRWLRAARAGGATTVEAALIFHYEVKDEAAAEPPRPIHPKVGSKIREVLEANESP